MLAAAMKTTFAPTVPEPATAVVKVVSPQPVVVGAVVPVTFQERSTMVTLSPAYICFVSPNVKAIEVGVLVYGLAIASPCTNAGVTFVEVTKEVAGKFPVATVAAMVRSARFATLYLFTSHSDGEAPPAHAIAPADHVNVHNVAAVRVAHPAVKVTAALVLPLLETAALKVVVPHPTEVGAVEFSRVQYGRVTTTLSPTARFCDIRKAILSAVAEPWVGVRMSNWEAVKERSVVAFVVIVSGGAGAYCDAAIVAAILRPFKLAFCAAAAVVVVIASDVIVHIVFAAKVAVATVKTTFAPSVPEA